MRIVGRPYLPDGRRLIIRQAKPLDYHRFGFEREHYLRGHTTGSRCWLAELDGRPVGWISVLCAVGHVGWRVHRLVVLDGARGIGVGRVLAGWTAARMGSLSLRTRNRGFVEALISSETGWRASRHGKLRTSPDRRTGGPGGVAWSAVYVPQALRDPQCGWCGTRMIGRRSHIRFCSARCRVAAHRSS